MNTIKQQMWLRSGIFSPEIGDDDPYKAECIKRMQINGTIQTPLRSPQAERYELRRKYAMSEDDMTFMHEVFMPENGDKPKLPFAQYIQAWGFHPLTQEANREVDTVQGDTKQGSGSAMAAMRRKYGEHYQVFYKVPRPDGTLTKLSVICGMMFYSRKDEPYEVMVYTSPEAGENEPLPYQTDEQLMLLIAKLLNQGDNIAVHQDKGEDHGLSK